MGSRALRVAIVAPALTALLLVAMLAGGACGGSAATATDAKGSAATATDVKFIPVGQFHVADYAGKPLVVNVFGSWCGPCNMEAPDLARFSKAYPQAAFVGVAVNDSRSAVTKFMGKYGLRYPVVLDDGRLSTMWGIRGVPTTIFYNAGGQEVDHILGAASLGQFKASFAKTQ